MQKVTRFGRVAATALVSVALLALSACGSNNTAPQPAAPQPAAPQPAAPQPAAPQPAPAAPAKEWEPKGNVTILAGAGPGSGWDTTARAALQALQSEKLIGHPVAVVNKAGGAGSLAVAEMVQQHKGKDDIILVTSLPIISNKIMGTSPYGVFDLTPIARIAATHYVIVVKPESDIKDLKDLLARLKQNPGSLSIGGSDPPADDWVAGMGVLSTGGVDVTKLKFVGFDGGQVATAVLGGQVQVGISTVGEMTQHIKAGKMRALATTGPQREPNLADVPTIKEQGVDAVFMNWRGFVGPANMPAEARAYWQKKFGAMVKTQTWIDTRGKHSWADSFLVDGFDKFLQENTMFIEDLLKRTGVLAKKS